MTVTDDVTNVDLFAPANVAPVEPEITLDQFVGEGKRYADASAVAKAIVHKDKHIDTLEGELAQLRAEIKQRITMEEFLDKATRPQNPPRNAAEQEPVVEVPSANSLKQEDVLKLIEERESAKARAQNALSVKEALVKQYGDDYVNVLTIKASDLGLTKADIKEMSETKPKALLTLLGSTKAGPSASVAPPTSSLNISAGTLKTGVKNFAYYQDILKKDKSRFLSPEIQMEMNNEALKQGANFYN